MSSAFNILTAGGAKFNKSKYKHDIELFSARQNKLKKTDKGKGKASEAPTSLPQSLDFFGDHPTVAHPAKLKRVRPTTSESESDNSSGSDSEASTSISRPTPPTQKITISGPEPLPRSIHTNIPALLNHPDVPTTSRAGAPLLRALKESGINSLWGVQCAVSGSLLEGHDTLCVAPTGSGKTLSYVLPVIVKLGDPARSLRARKGGEGRGVRCVIVVPTYDLGVQISEVIKAVTRGRSWRSLVLTKATEKAVCEASPGGGGGNMQGSVGDNEDVDAASGDDDNHDEGLGGAEVEDGQMDEDGSDEVESGEESTGRVNEPIQASASNSPAPLGIDFLVSTPERLHHLIGSGKLSLQHTKYLILDESDRLLSPDFLPQITPIVEACTDPSVQKCLLSATMPAGVEELGRKWLKDGGIRVVVGVKDSATTSIDQSLLYTSNESGKLLALQNLLSTGQLPYPTLIFVQSITRAEELHTHLLLNEHLKVGLIHSGKGKSNREETIQSFRKGNVWILVVTEVLARGMDFKGVKVVVNFDFPQTVQSYIHRIGRTGRAGRPGRAITFFSDEDGPYLRTIANVLVASGCPVPSYMLNLQKPSKNLKRRLAKAPVKRKEVGGGGRDLGREAGLRKKGIVEGSKRRAATAKGIELSGDVATDRENLRNVDLEE